MRRNAGIVFPPSYSAKSQAQCHEGLICRLALTVNLWRLVQAAFRKGELLKGAVQISLYRNMHPVGFPAHGSPAKRLCIRRYQL